MVEVEIEELHNLTHNGQIQPRLCGQISSQLCPFPGGQMEGLLDFVSHCNSAEPRNNGDTVSPGHGQHLLAGAAETSAAT